MINLVGRSCIPRQALITQNITSFAATMYLNKDISVCNKYYITVLPILIFMIITNLTWKM